MSICLINFITISICSAIFNKKDFCRIIIKKEFFGGNMNFSNDVLLILLLSILTSPTDEDGEVDFASNTNFLLLLLLVLQNSRNIDSCCNPCSCNNCNRCNACNRFL